MGEESFKDFRKKYKNRLDDDDVINMLLDNKMRNYIIENDDCDFLALIASSNSDRLREFYFNDQTLPYIVQLGKFPRVLFRSDFFPNKIKLFDNNLFLKYLTLESNTYHVMNHIEEELGNQEDNLELTRSLKDGLDKFIRYLQQDFMNNINNVSIFMKNLPYKFYKEFLDYILEDLKQIATENKEMVFDEIFSNGFIRCKVISFKDLESIINKFKGIDTLYY